MFEVVICAAVGRMGREGRGEGETERDRKTQRQTHGLPDSTPGSISLLAIQQSFL